MVNIVADVPDDAVAQGCQEKHGQITGEVFEEKQNYHHERNKHQRVDFALLDDNFADDVIEILNNGIGGKFEWRRLMNEVGFIKKQPQKRHNHRKRKQIKKHRQNIEEHV